MGVVTLLIHFLAESRPHRGGPLGRYDQHAQLAAAQQALRDVPGFTTEMAKLPGLGYAVAYPRGDRHHPHDALVRPPSAST